MKSLWRIVIVLTFSLLGMQGASACEHHHDVSSSAVHAQAFSMYADAAHCVASTTERDRNPSCQRTHSLCCMSACGVHCGALLSNAGGSARVASSRMPTADSDAMRASVTRAPPVRPPII
ncbi:hypothetical protein FRZ40_08130 [Paraburkholderia azotifigens]|uniref:CopL family metal-binding regulatory protein n=1 Tax=Paraburkholderia azotifigens TaxID=2057004 RepID=A0A5C6VQT3_9BURK|nr:hypothetical protein FRZ40_08130 [Paraburkholderia azotifigens]